MLTYYPLSRGGLIAFETNLDQVQYNDDGSVTAGDPDSHVCLDGNFLLDLLTKDYIEI